MKNKDIFFSYLYVTRNGMSVIYFLAVRALFFIYSRNKTKEVHFQKFCMLTFKIFKEYLQ